MVNIWAGGRDKDVNVIKSPKEMYPLFWAEICWDSRHSVCSIVIPNSTVQKDLTAALRFVCVYCVCVPSGQKLLWLLGITSRLFLPLSPSATKHRLDFCWEAWSTIDVKCCSYPMFWTQRTWYILEQVIWDCALCTPIILLDMCC